jgi:sec-independent protein translocase protein TatA
MPLSTHILALIDIGGGEMMAIFLLVLLLFGGKKMPELARGLGKSIREFKKVTSGVEDQIKQAIDEVPETPKPPARKMVVPVTPLATPPSPTPPPATPPEATP